MYSVHFLIVHSVLRTSIFLLFPEMFQKLRSVWKNLEDHPTIQVFPNVFRKRKRHSSWVLRCREGCSEAFKLHFGVPNFYKFFSSALLPWNVCQKELRPKIKNPLDSFLIHCFNSLLHRKFFMLQHPIWRLPADETAFRFAIFGWKNAPTPKNFGTKK